MKISSASKKVLASALSAAMVVAFAPTVAFGAIANDTMVEVTFENNGGTMDAEHGSKFNNLSARVSGGTLTLSGDAISNSAWLTNGDNAFDYWFYDANNDGVWKTADGDVKYDSSLDVSKIDQASAITLKAAYKTPTIAESDGKKLAGHADTKSAAPTKKDLEFVVDGLSVAAGTYYAKLSVPGVKDPIKVTATAATNKATFAFSQVDITAGTYTLAVYNNANDKLAISKEIKLSKVTLDSGAGYQAFADGAKTTYLVGQDVTVKQFVGTDYDNVVKPSVAVSGSTYTAQGYTLDGVVATGIEDKIEGDITLVATYNNPQVNFASYTDKTLTFTPGALSGDASIDYWSATVSGAGISKTWKIANAANNVTLAFAQHSEGTAAERANAYSTTAPEAAGVYTLTLTPVAAKDKTLPAGVTAVSATATLAAVSFDLGEGTVSEANKTAYATAVAAVSPAIVAAGTSLQGFNSTEMDAVKALITTPANKGITGWTVNGVKYNDATAAKDLKIPAAGMVIAPVYSVTAIAAPTYTKVLNADKTVTLTFTAPAGATSLKYAINGGTAYDVPVTGITVATTKTVVVTATDANGATGVLTLKDSTDAKTAFTTFAKAALGVATFDSTATSPKLYSAVLKTAQADGAKAIEDKVYQSTVEWTADVVAQKKAIVDGMAAYANEQLVAAKTLTKSADGKTYSYLSDAEYANAVAAVAAAVEAFVANNDAAIKDVATVNGVNVAGNDGKAYADAINAGYAKGNKTTVAAAVAEPAIAAEGALKAATTVETAEAALAQFEALTAAQQELVSSSAVAAAQKIVLVDTQDASAAKDVKAVNKTYKSKNGKLAATKTFKMKAITSKSGAKATYKKANTAGKSKITVAKSGKVTIKKGLKKGTYKVKVKGTVGAHAKTVTCKIVVK